MNGENPSRIAAVKVTSILVNWCQPERTLLAVDALRNQTFQSQIIVVDNGSTDGSVELLKAKLPSGVILIVGNSNIGFGAGCNLGIEESMKLNASYIWLLNNDAIPETSCLERMMRVAVADSRIGIVGSAIVDPQGVTPVHSGSLMNGLTLGIRYTLSSDQLNKHEYAWITGASMLLKAPVVKQVGNFSPKFFMYWEDADLCARIKRHGYKLEVASDSFVFHEAGTSSNCIPLTRYQWHLDSCLRWLERNYKPYFIGVIIVFFRHIVASSVGRNLPRLKMTLLALRSFLKKEILTSFGKFND